MTECVDKAVMDELVDEVTKDPVRYDVDKAALNERLKDPAEFAKVVKGVRVKSRLVAGWEVNMSLRIYADGEQHWHASAMLWPSGRCSSDADWANLGRIVALTGAPQEVAMEQLDHQTKTVHPNKPHHWIWYEQPKGKTS